METTFIALCIGLIAVLTGGLIAIRAMRNAPEGFEDADGFHIVRDARKAGELGYSETAEQGGGLGLAA
jgi:hypothetical protein